MAPLATIFMLLLGIHGQNGAFGLTGVGEFPSHAECQRAAAAAKAALGPAGKADLFCVDAKQLEALLKGAMVP